MSCRNTCLTCGRPSKDPLEWRCECGGALETKVEAEYSSGLAGTIFQRFSSQYPYIDQADMVSLGESETPLVRTKDAAFKLEYLLPTGSFKDRGSCALISGIHRWLAAKGIRNVKEDSSGNAGASVAAYSARAGIHCQVYVPAAVSGPKALQIQMYGAELIRIPGSRSHVTKAAQAEKEGSAYVGHIWHPYFRDGMRTLAYEIYEQLGGKLPESVYLPVSAGTLLLGFISGIQHLRSSGRIERLPRVVACQTKTVSPLYAKLTGTAFDSNAEVKTIADALVSTAPPLLNHMAAKVREVGGEAQVATEAEVLTAWKELAGRGLYVEPSSAVPYACLRRTRGESGPEALVILTGSGLKSKEEALRSALG